MSPIALIIVALGLGAGALAKGAIGLGLPLIALPILASYFELPHAVAILTIPIIVTNIWQVWQYRAHAAGLSFVWSMLATGLVGIAFGTWFLTTSSGQTLALALAIFLGLYVVLRLTRPSLALPRELVGRVAPVAGLAAGALQGSMGTSGPVLLSFMDSLRLEREPYIFAISLLFLGLGFVQLVALAVAGVFTWTTAAEGVFALLPIAVAMPLGAWLGNRFSRAMFERLILLFLVIMVGNFLYRGLGL